MAKLRAATEAERALWGAAMRDVRRLDPKRALPVFPPLPAPPSSPEIAELPQRPPTLVRARPGGADGATIERLKRGQIAIEARIDLHGLDQRAAFASLMGFIETSSRAGRRAVLVITGKGSVSDGGGILRRNVPGWLTASPLGGRILTIQQAHTRHGGDGALYVLLRRKRP
ncbi:MAG: mismatch repair protein MutS [Rhodospirillales bacterium]|nr:mismatch repair protein MutS [Rhodospirillales bacterium]